MVLLFVVAVAWVALAIVKWGFSPGSGPHDEPEEQQAEVGGAVLQVQRVQTPDVPIPGPPRVVGFVAGLIVAFIGWALWQ
jgi:hypothetical protein